MESLKIALATDWFFPSFGGIEYHVDELARELTKLGHEVHVITKEGDYPDEELPYPVHRFRGFFTLEKYHVTMGPLLLRDINRLYKKEKFDFTHAHSIYSPLAVAVANLSAGIRGVPSTITNHSLVDRSSLHPVSLLILRNSLGRVTSFIAVSKAVKEETEELMGNKLKNRPIFVVPNGLDMDYWRPPEDKEEVKERLGLEGTVVTTVLRFTKKKGAHLVPEIAREVVRDGITYVLIGDGPLREEIEEKVKKYGLEGSLVLTGKLPREKVREYLWATDVYVSPTKYEAFGIATLEALATGVPVVVDGYGGVRDYVEHGKNGFLAGSTEEIVKYAKLLLEDEGLRERIGKYGRKSVERRFDWSMVIKKVLDAYKRTMDIFVEDYYPLYWAYLRIVGDERVKRSRYKGFREE